MCFKMARFFPTLIYNTLYVYMCHLISISVDGVINPWLITFFYNMWGFNVVMEMFFKVYSLISSQCVYCVYTPPINIGDNIDVSSFCETARCQPGDHIELA